MKIQKTSVIIVAAGTSSRMGGQDKLFAMLANKPVLQYSLEAFQKAESIDEIVVVTRSENIPKVQQLCISEEITKVTNVVSGGEDRSASVKAGLNAIDREYGVIAIHDGARPIIDTVKIDDVIEAAKAKKAAILAVPANDTIKTVANGVVKTTPNRGALYIAQTPQAFDLRLYRDATRGGVSATDDSLLIERAGNDVHIVEGDYSNIKITVPDDLILALALITARKESEKLKEESQFGFNNSPFGGGQFGGGNQFGGQFGGGNQFGGQFGGGNQFGGGQFGGNQFGGGNNQFGGGNQFGGNNFGAN